jgi:putative aldouronate transport system permease protein
MVGAQIAFRDFNVIQGMWGSPWVGFREFTRFFESPSFWRLIENTFSISITRLLLGFPAPIILALALNEISRRSFKRSVQMVTYAPHFISTVVVVGMMYNFLGVTHGWVNNVFDHLGMDRINFFLESRYFRFLYVSSGVWQGFGWSSIIFIATISSIDAELYEAAVIDGARRVQQMRYITIPGIMPTIVIILIFTMGNMMNVGFEKIILMYNPATYEVADVIQSYIFRRGLIDFDYSFSAAVGLFNSVINLALLVAANYLARRIGETSLW